jgi:hypothetical protein
MSSNGDQQGKQWASGWFDRGMKEESKGGHQKVLRMEVLEI